MDNREYDAAIEEFGRLLMQHVRDPAVRDCDKVLVDEGDWTGARWRQAVAAGGEVVIPDCVDRALYFLLYAIDQELIRLRFTTESGRDIDLTARGELAGLLLGNDHWRPRFSRERSFSVVDEFAMELAMDAILARK